MRVIVRLALFVVILFVGYLFAIQYRHTLPWGYGTGNYGQNTGNGSSGARTTRLEAVASNPAQYDNQRLTLTGRVRQPVKYAANRNVYFLSTPDGARKIMVVDDGPTPPELYTRTVTGTIKRVPGTNFLYLVSVRSNPHILPPMPQIKSFFANGYLQAQQGLTTAGHAVSNAVH